MQMSVLNFKNIFASLASGLSYEGTMGPTQALCLKLLALPLIMAVTDRLII